MTASHTLSPPRNKLLRAMGTISLFTLLSRILGFIRDIVIAQTFGAGMAADAFFVAQKIPNFLRRLFAEGAFSSAFVPIFSDYLSSDQESETRRAVEAIFTYLTFILVLVVLTGQIFMPYLMYLIAPGFMDDAEKYTLTVDLTRITFPYILFISLVSLSGGILNSYDRFALTAATPILLNVCLIFGALILSPLFDRPAVGLAVGILLGGIIQLALQFPALKRIGLPFRWRWEPGHPAIKRILTLMGPSIFGVSVSQVNLLFDVFIASWLPAGSISYLYYADRLVEFPLGLVGIALGTAILPALSLKASKGDIEGLKTELIFALRITLILNIPATVGLIVLREPILAMLFERGAFDATNTQATAQALIAYGLGLVAFSSIKVIAPAFFALKDTRTPVRVAMLCMLSNMVLNVALMFPLKHTGLALATTLAAFLNSGLLLYFLHRKLQLQLIKGILPTLLKTTLASTAMAAFLIWSQNYFWYNELSRTKQGLILTVIIMIGLGIFLLAARLIGMTEIVALLKLLKRSSAKKQSQPQP
ncbi:MAG: murein biosynthesis integral membrane protein MurJ [Magnetococcus sp. DMHC-6]